ncbi:helix-turn-helix domain-containing protein [Serratia marcescens]|uniref:helix-turn-helix domain-containing protein n=1 Tax=Serratia TaxID=613 RepID=UPI00294B0598|nr:LysR family transcriptional regulator [Serratia marcescens]MCF1216675.1 LysR family transcriptional regulator [Serratia marcescens]MCF1319199.1 LysR family transcriptional regulator [Serratia marcescens]MCF1323953.1 LysR family transcriptional regulator [Serratia marcescens]
MLTLRQLRQFLVVAETMNIRKAAERLHMAQPPLTHDRLRAFWKTRWTLASRFYLFPNMPYRNCPAIDFLAARW